MLMLPGKAVVGYLKTPLFLAQPWRPLLPLRNGKSPAVFNLASPYMQWLRLILTDMNHAMCRAEQGSPECPSSIRLVSM